ncbi:MAG: DUF1449 family protein [Pirellulales bacterium]|nr:DUF1449 family protein [Pirellulales bacterium]
MMDLFYESIAPVNLPYTVMLALVVLYWLLYIVGAVSEDALDFMGLDFDADVDVDADIDADIDIDADVDADVDADMDADMGHAGSAHPLAAFLHFFHVGDVPVILILSVLVVFMWMASMITTHFLGIQLFWVALAMSPAILVVGLIATKAVILPFAPYLKNLLKQEGDKVEVIGKTCTIVSLEATEKFGQAEMKIEGAPLLLNVKTREGVTLHKGDEGVVFDHDKETNTYLIGKFDINEKSTLEE